MGTIAGIPVGNIPDENSRVFPWGTAVSHGMPCDPAGIRGIPRERKNIPRDTVGSLSTFHCLPWGAPRAPTVHHGIPCGFPWGFPVGTRGTNKIKTVYTGGFPWGFSVGTRGKNTIVFAIYQIVLGWKTSNFYCETDELPNPRPTQPKTN